MDEQTREKTAYKIGMEAQSSESYYRKMQEDIEETRSIYAAYEANPTPETLKGLLYLQEQLHANAAQALQQGEDLRGMVADLEARIISLRERELAAQSEPPLAERFKRERECYEKPLEACEMQLQAALEMIELVKRAVKRTDAIMEREIARVAALYPPKGNNGAGE